MNLTQNQVLKLSIIYKVYKGITKISELDDDDKIVFATCTKRCMNTSKGEKERWAPDWQALGFSKLGSKERDAIWKRIAEFVHQAVQTKQSLPRKTMAAQWEDFAELDEDTIKCINKEETSFQNVYNIYEGTKKVVHKRQIEKLSDKLGGESADAKVIEVLKKLNPTIPQIAAIQRYINIAVRNKTKARIDMFLLPEHILELRNKFREKEFSTIPLISFKKDAEKIIANLGLCGYRMALVTPVLNKQKDISYYKPAEILDVLQVKLLQTNELMGLASIYKHEGRPTQMFMGLTGDTVKTRITPKLYIDLILQRYEANKEVIDKYIDKPKSFYIKSIKDEPYQWNYEAIALDIFHNEKLALNPELFMLIPIFQDKEPVEWLNEI